MYIHNLQSSNAAFSFSVKMHTCWPSSSVSLVSILIMTFSTKPESSAC